MYIELHVDSGLFSDPESIKDAETLNQNNNVKGVTFSVEVPFNEEDIDDDDGEHFTMKRNDEPQKEKWMILEQN